MDFYSLAFNSLILGNHVFAGLYSLFFVDITNSENIEIQTVDRFKLRFLTLWNMVAQGIYVFYAIYADIREHYSKNKDLKVKHEFVKGLFYTTIIVPSGFFVCGSFWILWSIDRELVFPRIYDEYIPYWLNHSIHSAIILLPIVGLLSKKTIPKWWTAFFVASLYFFSYQITVLYTYFESSIWLYKVFDVLPWPTRICYFTFNYTITIVFLIIAMFLQGQVNVKKYHMSTLHKSIVKKLT